VVCGAVGEDVVEDGGAYDAGRPCEYEMHIFWSNRVELIESGLENQGRARRCSCFCISQSHGRLLWRVTSSVPPALSHERGRWFMRRTVNVAELGAELVYFRGVKLGGNLALGGFHPSASEQAHRHHSFSVEVVCCDMAFAQLVDTPSTRRRHIIVFPVPLEA
jgi:hypothetical protein